MPGGGIRWERKGKGKTQSQRRRERIESVARDQGSVSRAKDLSSYTALERDRYQSSLRSEVAGATDAAGSGRGRDRKLEEINRKEAEDRIWLEQRGFVTLFPLTQTTTGGGTADAPAGGFGLRNSVALPSRNSFSFDSRFVAQQTHSESPRWYTPFSGLSRPKNSRQQERFDYPFIHVYDDSESHNHSTPANEDSSYSSTNSIYASFAEFSQPPPNPLLQHTQQHGEPANTFCTWADSGFTPNFLSVSASYKYSSPNFGPSSSFNIGQPLSDQGLETQSHFADTQIHSGPYIGQPIAGSQDSQDSIVRQSLANQLEVTSTLPGGSSSDLERYKDLGSTPPCPPQVPVANRSPSQLEVTPEFTYEPRMKVYPESMDEPRSSDRSRPLPTSYHSSAPIPAPVTMDSTLWLHVQVVHPPPVDLSDSSSQLLQYEQYIKNTIEPQVAKYIMGNTPLYLPSFSSVSAEATMSLEILKPLTPEYCQEHNYFLMRLDGIVRDLKALSVEHVYWKAKQKKLIGDMKGNIGWVRRKMEERVRNEAKALSKKQTAVVDELMGSPKADKGKAVDKEERTLSGSVTSDESNITSSSMASNVVRAIEGAINAMFDEDDEEDRSTFQRWDDERDEAERLATMNAPQTPDERVAEERLSAQNPSLERYIIAGTAPIEVRAPAKAADVTIPTRTPTSSGEQGTAVHPNTATRRFIQQKNERLARVGWIRKETEHPRKRVHSSDVAVKGEPRVETPDRRGTVSLITPPYSRDRKGTFIGSPYERTWTNLPPTPSPAPRVPKAAMRADTTATSHLQFGDIGWEETQELQKKEKEMVKESTQPYIAKDPSKEIDVRRQHFYARLSASGIRADSPSVSLQNARLAPPPPRAIVRLPGAWPSSDEAAAMGGSRRA